MLPYYAARFPTVEINYTFYRMPTEKLVGGWAAQTPSPYKLTLKAPRRITHEKRLRDAEAEVTEFVQRAAALGNKLGVLLFQLPPFLKKDLPRLSEFLRLLPEGHRAAFEFRNDSWFADDVYDALKGAGAALCLSEREDNAPPPLVETAPWGYVRLRLEGYSEDELRAWAARLEATSWQQTHVYFMHEPTAPGYAQSLMRFESRP
jgi:uncharacterized protein YecE (DUF72 family)